MRIFPNFQATFFKCNPKTTIEKNPLFNLLYGSNLFSLTIAAIHWTALVKNMLLLKVSVSSLCLQLQHYFAKCGFGAIQRTKTMNTNWENWTIGFQSSTLQVVADVYTLRIESGMWNTFLFVFAFDNYFKQKLNTIEIWQMKNQLSWMSENILYYFS